MALVKRAQESRDLEIRLLQNRYALGLGVALLFITGAAFFGLFGYMLRLIKATGLGMAARCARPIVEGASERGCR